MPTGRFIQRVRFFGPRRATCGRFLTVAAAAGLGLAAAAPAFSQPAPVPPEGSLVPVNLSASSQLRDTIGVISSRSPTFRRQCSFIAATRHLAIRIREAGPRGDRPYAARTIIRRHQFGAITADVELHTPFDPAEIIAHEFEHVIEQVQGLNLRLLSFVVGSGVVRSDDGSFETRRAVIAGHRVARECRAGDGRGVVVEPTY